MNETLEAMARALFKSWFVDFLPVRAKMAARTQTGDPPPAPQSEAARQAGGLPKHLADLFPDSFEDSELGAIPKGWTVAPLPDIIDVNPTRALRKGEIAPYLDMANMPTRGHSPDVVIERPFGSGMRYVNGDTLVARITPCLENGKTAYVDFIKDGQVGWGSTEYIVLRPKPPLPTEFAYCLARSEEFRDFAIQSMTGSSGRQRVPTESLSHLLVVSPSKDVAELFGRLIKPLFARASDAAEESRALAALRDTLLPKLISGELRVKDPARFLERVVE
jgi:type I restriction enzyme S subunit